MCLAGRRSLCLQIGFIGVHQNKRQQIFHLFNSSRKQFLLKLKKKLTNYSLKVWNIQKDRTPKLEY